ncbi:stabilin-2-like isoform X1 [Asterias rubens]|uniref:stabilin-2-like isoform X1 n=1 Tax=Asterias rubens TaxID=7604 RepID=UPI0014550F99|nr:stabilin-2-like isoform X1 [Asterias rubens]
MNAWMATEGVLDSQSSRSRAAGATGHPYGMMCDKARGTVRSSARSKTPTKLGSPKLRFAGLSWLIVLWILYFISQCSCLSLEKSDHLIPDKKLRHERSIATDQPNSRKLNSTVSRVVRTDCVLCSISKPTLCPPGSVPLTQGSGDRGCVIVTWTMTMSFAYSEIIGCSQQCRLTEVRQECYPGYWGPMCLECPGGASNPCNGRGRCQGQREGEQCQCNPAFTGVSCELCAAEDAYGPNCDQVCDCVYGVCNAGSTGNGFCLCEEGYQGPRCDLAKTSCGDAICHPFAICSPPISDVADPLCVCSPGYTGDGRLSCAEIDPCQREGVCSVHAHCNHTSPGKHTCQCLFGYYGDGKECHPINRCQQEPSVCPPPSSKCVFDGPMRYHCDCMEGYDDYLFPNGCQKIDMCVSTSTYSPPQCPRHSVCSTMPDSSRTRCECERGFQGDGTACHGNILQVLHYLNTDINGPMEGMFDISIGLLEMTMGYVLSSGGLFTVFVPTDEAIREVFFDESELTEDVELARYLMKLHVIPTYLDTFMLNRTRSIYTLAGIMAEVTPKDGNPDVLRYRIEGSNEKGKLIYQDIPAANGVIHVIDKVLYEAPLVPNNPEESVATIISTTGRFNRMQTLMLSVGVSNVIYPYGFYTILAPMNKAFNQLPEGSIDYLMSTEGRPKLIALLRNHVVVDHSFLMLDLITRGGVTSLHGSTTNFHIRSNGLIQMDGKANMTFSDIVAWNGYIHSIDGLLVPPDIEPLISHRCDSVNYGNTTVKQCCPGFYGENCLPCPGGFAIPCRGHGLCTDGWFGSGTCTCDEGFQGTACELCDANLFGVGCNQTCTCINGICDSGPAGTGQCIGGCHYGYTGPNCNNPIGGCGLEFHVCHEHAVCESSGSELSCVCQAGYLGSGLHCEPVNRCILPERGNCHQEAVCSYTGPGLSTCTCNDGWSGDGYVCTAIDPCQSADRGGCGDGAICAYIRPGKNKCSCNLGYSGNGTYCEPINPCLLMTNGGCHAQADCVQTGPGTSDCQCRDGYGGDGFRCYQSLLMEISKMQQLGSFYDLIMIGEMDRYLATYQSLTVFAPTDEATNQFVGSSDIVTPRRATEIVKMHIVNGTFSERALYRLAFDVDQNIPTLFPDFDITVHDCNQHLCVNGIPVSTSDIPSTNGLIHIVNEVLAPLLHGDEAGFVPAGLVPSGAASVTETPPFSFSQLVNQTQPNSAVLDLLQQNGLLDDINTASSYTVFLPSNDAVTSFNASKVTRDILRYHVVLGQTLTSADMYNGMHIDSGLGHNYQLRFRKNSTNLFVNNVMVESPDLLTDRGVVHVISEVMIPLQNHCDIEQTRTTLTECGSCDSPPECPPDTAERIVPSKSNCIYTQEMFHLAHVPGCRVTCRGVSYIPWCCLGFFGPDCAECPGGWLTPCSNNGRCSSGIDGVGTCSCDANFIGTACELCQAGHYGQRCDGVCSSCVNGRCREGIHGDGRCICNTGYTGLQCDIAVTSSNQCSEECDPNAYCLDQQCLCYNGFIWNGSNCEVYNSCSEHNICSEHATCWSGGDGPSCFCSWGYEGDGIYCGEVNPCLEEDDGGCHELADCIHTGPGMSACHCQPGYEGDGRTRCSPIDPCSDNNGGCSVRAHCVPTGPALRNCTCFDNHIGDGIECIGNIAEELVLNRNFTQFVGLLQSNRDVLRLLGSSRAKMTLLAPSNEAFEHIDEAQIIEWNRNHQTRRILMHHIVGCTGLLSPHINGSITLGTLAARQIQIHYSTVEGLSVNSEVRVTAPDYETSNGIIHTIDKILIPSELGARPGHLEQLPLELVATNATYSIFIELMERCGLLEVYNNPMMLPLTVFMPTNEAFMSLYPGKLAELRDPMNIETLREYLKYHIISHRKIQTTQMATREIREATLQGSNISMACQMNQGVLVNGDSKIVEFETAYRDGLFYGLDTVLEPPSIGGRCDDIQNITFTTDCHSCSRTIQCPPGSVPVGGNLPDCFYSVGWFDYQGGCVQRCLRQKREPRCCERHYGPDCRECPGGVRNPCSWRGVCDDTYTGSGSCLCDQGFTGVACELCQRGRYGPDCDECQCTRNGQCEDGVSGTGHCFCDAGYSGIQCETQLSVIPVCDPPCHMNAVCRQRNQCQCRSEYYGSGYSCTVINQCINNNGGCSMYANCTQVGTEADCRCHANYEGDGHVCQPVDPCMVNNGECHQDAMCKLTGPNARSCTCIPPLQGDGIVCSEPNNRPGQGCSIDNGGCHINAICIDGTNNPVGPPQTLPTGRQPFDGEGLPPSTGVRCQCKEGYNGTGVLCNGNAKETLSNMRNLSMFYQALVWFAKQSKAGDKLADSLMNANSKLTLFIPVNSAELANTTFTGMLIGNHIVTDQMLLRNQLVNGSNMISWSQGKLVVDIAKADKSVRINGVPIAVFDIPTTNGILHIMSLPIQVIKPKSSDDISNSSAKLSGSRLFASVLITIFVVIFIFIVIFIIVIKVRRKKNADSRQVVSRYRVRDNDEGNVTFACHGDTIDEDEESSEPTFPNPTFHKRSFELAGMDDDTVGFAELDYNRAY